MVVILYRPAQKARIASGVIGYLGVVALATAGGAPKYVIVTLLSLPVATARRAMRAPNMKSSHARHSRATIRAEMGNGAIGMSGRHAQTAVPEGFQCELARY